MKKTKRQLNMVCSRFVVFALCLSMVCGFFNSSNTQAVTMGGSVRYGKTISLSQAKSLALSNSIEYTSLKSKLALAEAKYSQAVKAIQLKKKNKSTFRWSPLLSFKFPEKADLADEFQYEYEPISKQADIERIKHQINNNKYTEYEKVTLLYVKCYTLQESIAFTEERVQGTKEALEKNKALLLAGQANQSDIDKIEKNLKNLNDKLLADQREFEIQKEKLTDCIGLDVRSGYSFLNPYITADISRSKYDYIVSYTEARDQKLYEARVTTTNARIALDTNEQLMRSQYGSKMDMISSFIQQAKNGEKIDTAAFKLKYDEFLKKIDEPWNGKFKILFIKIPKEWIKGEIDGVRYVEDEPYALYESAVDYQDALLEEKSVQKDLEDQLNDGFNNYISVRQTYTDLVASVEEKREEVEKATAQNLLGKLTYDELSDLQTEYEDTQMEMLTALSDYTSALVSYDKLSCGALTSLFDSTGITTSTANGGSSYIVSDDDELDDDGSGSDGAGSYVVADDVEGVYYYIHSLASENVFEFGLYVPEEFEITLTDFELWINGIKVGEKTPINKTIKHLGLDFDTIESAFVRLYDGSKVVDDSSFDPEVYSDKLIITANYQIRDDGKRTIATYKIDKNPSNGMVTIEIKTDISEIAFYDIKTKEGIYLAGIEKQGIQSKMKYLDVISNEMETLTFCFYDETGKLIYECKIDGSTNQLVEKDD